MKLSGFRLPLLLFFVWALAQVPGFGQGATLVIPSGHGLPVREVLLSPAGKIVATAGNDYLLKLRTYPAGKELLNLPVQRQFKDIDFARNDRFLAYLTHQQFGLINAEKGTVAWAIDYTKAERLAFSPTEDRLYLAQMATCQTGAPRGNDTIRLRYLDYLMPSPKILVHRNILVDVGNFGSVDLMSLSPDGKYLLVAGTQKQALLFDLSSTAPAQLLTGARKFLPNGNILYCQASSATALHFAAKTPQGSLVWERTADYGETIFLTGYQGMISADATSVFISVGSKFLTELQTATGILLRSGRVESIEKPFAVAVADGETLLLGGLDEDTGISRLSRRDHRVVGQLGPRLVAERFVDAVGKQRGLVLAGAQGLNYWTSLYDRSVINLPLLPQGRRLQAAGSPDGNYLVTYGPDQSSLLASGGILYLRSASILGQTRTLKTQIEQPHQLEFSPDSRHLLVGGVGGLDVFAVADGRLVFSQKFSSARFNALNAFFTVSYTAGPSAAFSPDGKELVYLLPRASGNSLPERTLTRATLDGGAVKWQRQVRGVAVRWPTAATVVLTEDAPLAHQRLNAADGSPAGAALRVAGDIPSGRIFETSPNGRYQAVLAKDIPRLDLIDLNKGQLLATLRDFTYRVDDVSFFHDDFLVTTDMAGKMKLWDARSGKLLADFLFFQDDNDWAVLSPEGFFDGSEGALAKAYYRTGNTFAPLEQYYANFYVPGLLGSLLQRAPIAPAAAPISTLNPPPKVTFTLATDTRNLYTEDEANDEKIPRFELSSPEVRITVRAEAPNDVVKEIRLFHNGKILGEGSRNLVVEEDVQQGNTAERTYRFRLLPGENRIRVLALNSQLTESKPSEFIANYTSAVPETNDGRPVLFLLVAGINSYRNSNYDLSYAQPDAEAFHTAIRAGAAGIVERIEDYYLLNQDATREKLLAAFADIRAKARPQDLLVFYYAGHGEMPYGAEGDFYLVLHGVTNIFADGTGSARAQGLSASELRELSGGILAQKQVYLLDACKSAGALQQLTRGVAEEKAIAQLARATGTHWITAAGSTQEAHELAELGHGLFTYAMLAALNGAADGVKDGRITVSELKAYLSDQVPELAQRYRGAAQYPNTFGKGQDFPLVLVRKR
ncbi:caspase family protein [Neolewinella lacunae]|uniref:Caspase family protein n=1 Tax=Neolewinella lacunae TaxID=1517758 RepID=A0A923PI40_9BACT|nr:caspase family protein [Neolewinella lacunae]MBC6993111.1 caspase family protein [Neolewinella lacunae]MDN3635931.1 caspase family protein [Neolewinella lacunae]